MVSPKSTRGCPVVQITGHEVTKRLLTTILVQTSLALAVTALAVFGPQFVGMYIPKNGTASPGANARLSRTMPAWSSTTKTLFNVALPELLTTPEKNTKSPMVSGFGGHSRLTAIRGVVILGQTALAVAMTLLPAQISFPRAVT